MANETARIREARTLQEANERLHTLVDADRRVLSRKQTIGYMIFDGSRDFNIDKHKDLFLNSILKVDFDLQARANVIGGVWDIVDDFIVGSIMEKSRTRWGKFIPFIGIGGVSYAVISIVFWLLPLFFTAAQNNDFGFMPKYYCYLLFSLALEFAGNIRNVAIDGYISTVTPYPSDRRRLLAISGYFYNIYSRLPDLAMEFLLDGVKKEIIRLGNRTKEEMIRLFFFTLGPVTMVLTAAAFLWYTTVAKERVHQKIERPRVIDSLRIVFRYKPVLLFMISNALGSLGTGLSTNDYYRQVLDWTTFETFAGIPSFFFQPIGYANYNKLAARFSTKSLYMIGQVAAKTFYIPLFFYGMFLKDKKGDRLFTNAWAMLPVTALWEIIYATFWGVRSISINEMRNECNDYLEWKCGCRSEATFAAASAFITKVPARINAIFQPYYQKWTDYDQEAYTHDDRYQPERAQKWIFAMATLIPALIVLVSMIPIFWFDIDKATRNKMYMELNARRAAAAERIRREADGEAPEETE